MSQNRPPKKVVANEAEARRKRQAERARIKALRDKGLRGELPEHSLGTVGFEHVQVVNTIAAVGGVYKINPQESELPRLRGYTSDLPKTKAFRELLNSLYSNIQSLPQPDGSNVELSEAALDNIWRAKSLAAAKAAIDELLANAKKKSIFPQMFKNHLQIISLKQAWRTQ